ncbi:MAG: thioredoxin fold domain-containing protein [Geminicoccaceae bacterium]
MAGLLLRVVLAAVVILGLGIVATPGTRAAELVMFESKTCHWCAHWHAEIGPVYAKTAEGVQAPLRRVDIADRDDPLLRRFGPITFTPTFVVIEGDAEIGRIRGYPGEDHFWGLLGMILADLPGS